MTLCLRGLYFRCCRIIGPPRVKPVDLFLSFFLSFLFFFQSFLFFPFSFFFLPSLYSRSPLFSAPVGEVFLNARVGEKNNKQKNKKRERGKKIESRGIRRHPDAKTHRIHEHRATLCSESVFLKLFQPRTSWTRLFDPSHNRSPR